MVIGYEPIVGVDVDKGGNPIPRCGQCYSRKDLKVEVVSGWLLCSDCRQKMLDSLKKLR